MAKGVKIKRLPKVTVKMREGGIRTAVFWWVIHQNLELVRVCKEYGKLY